MPSTLDYFKQITQFPRPSKHEEAIRQFLENYFSSFGYKTILDSVGNLIVYVPAKNSTSTDTIILQAHMDMVCVKTSESTHDFSCDAIEWYEQDGFLRAKNTTLWADNGIGIALAMKAIHFENHPALELVFTVDEEDGMSGVMWLDGTLLQGNKVLNLDSEDENEICISSAWGIGISGKYTIKYTGSQLNSFRFELSWMKGWHSGVEIHKKRGNALKLWLEIVSTYQWKIEISKVDGWIAHNVIPSKVTSFIGVDSFRDFESHVVKSIEEAKNRFDCPEITYTIEEHTHLEKVVHTGDQLWEKLSQIPDGVYTMSQYIEWLVETSQNLGVLKVEESELSIVYLTRSSNNEALLAQKNGMEQHLLNLGGNVEFDRGYPGWQDDPNSSLLKTVVWVFEEVRWETPKVMAIHAGLECGALVNRLGRPWINALSFWPNIFHAHSVNECVEIASVERIEKILEEVLKRL